MSEFKHQLNAQFAKVAKALGHANRLEILDYLSQREHSVESLTQVSGISYANCSQHLQQLKAVGLVSNRKEGQHVYYQVANQLVYDCIDALQRLAHHNLAEVDRLVDQHLNHKDHLEPISSEELMARLKDDLVTLIDVRPAEEYQAGHIAGALNVTLAELEGFVEQHQAHKEVIAYCRGPYCVLSFEAVERLRALGIPSHRLEAGFPQWQLEGLPVES
ncbi:MAG: metalloregulator ArsR/SmtB family transcription factor [bacterium]|nr:metalloregulator ArsR/SmtB family transcription factor [bacterium]